MSQSISFLKYNNAVPLVLLAVFGITSASFAASPDVRNAVYESKQEIRRVDNTYIVNADIKNHDFKMQVTDVKEDTDSYYVTYSYRTISLVDSVWQDTPITGSLKVSKKELEGRDLGLYVAKQLGELVDTKRDYLVDVQKHERAAGATPKVVATTYSGIVGKFLDSKEETFPGYVAVIAPTASSYDNPLPANTGSEEAPQEPAGAVSVSLPNTDAPSSSLSAAQIEQLVADQVRAILTGAPAPASSPEPSSSGDTSTSAPDTTTVPETSTTSATTTDVTATSSPTESASTTEASTSTTETSTTTIAEPTATSSEPAPADTSATDASSTPAGA